MSFGPITPSPLGGMFGALCTITPRIAGQDAQGVGIQTNGTPMTPVQCSLQRMSNTGRMAYKAVTAATLWDLYLPTRRGDGTAVVVSIEDRITIGAAVYRAIGDAVAEGGGVQVVPVERRDA